MNRHNANWETTRFAFLGALLLTLAIGYGSAPSQAQCLPQPLPEIDAQTLLDLGQMPGPYAVLGCTSPPSPSPCLVPDAPTIVST